uniref:NADH-ubiquinone oxidoreductase chain 4L n=1 Tax=Platerodrilus sp. MNCN/DNA:86739 TaxID=1905348 RepID=A0A342Z5F0_9COLE|nr:NADH dehydrogenase subunit 4L [Platerodrilus sp. MNCN/DNA:86739]
MMILSFYICLYSYFTGLVNFVYKCKYFMLMLLSLEFMMISILFFMFHVFIVINDEFYFSLIYLSMVVCESSLGLSLLVVMVRSYGNDYFQVLNVLW